MSKECLFCGEDNSDSATICKNCGGVFSNIETSVNSETENPVYIWKIRCPVSGNEYDVESENSRMEICDCCEDEIDKHEIAKERPFKILINRAASKEAVAAETPAVSAAKEPAPMPILKMTDLSSNKVIKINDSCIIGRSGDIETDFFAEDLYISEFHCKVILDNGEYKIEHLPTATNPTRINNVKLGKGIRSIIRNGDYLKIADKTFEITLRADVACDENIYESAKPVNNDSADEVKYSITCPKCGTEYTVHSIDDKINECTNCDDYDKREISGIRAEVKHAN